jgi:very-short-patch-repair endonuclease
MTDAERHLWSHLRRRQLVEAKFRRQASIGRYIVDFVCFEEKLIIELDGGQHTEQVEYDEQRTSWLNSQGFRVLRFWNHEVFEDLDSVLEVILNALENRTPPPRPSPIEGGGRHVSEQSPRTP